MPYRLTTPELETQAHHIRSVRPSRLRVDSLWAIAIRQIGIDNERAADLITQARDVADQIRYETGIALCDIATAMLAIRDRDTEKATLLIHSIESRNIDDEHIRGWTSLLRAHLHEKNDEDAETNIEVEAMAEAALSAYTNLVIAGDMFGISECLNLLGIAFGALNDPRTAVSYALEQYNVLLPLDDSELLLTPLGQIGMAYGILGEDEKEAFYLREGLRISQMLLEENDTPLTQHSVSWFATYYGFTKVPRSLLPQLPHRTAYDKIILLRLQRLLVGTQRIDETRRAEEADFALEPMSEEMEAHFARMKALREQDALTGLYHRGYLESVLPAILQEKHLTETAFSVLLLDIDHFSTLNETYGSLYADYVLHQVGELLTTTYTAPLLPTRYTGDQFLVVLAGYDGSAAYTAAKTLHTTIAHTTWTVKGVTLAPFTISIGVSTFQNGDTVDTLFQRVEAALARAKREGGNRIVSTT